MSRWVSYQHLGISLILAGALFAAFWRDMTFGRALLASLGLLTLMVGFNVWNTRFPRGRRRGQSSADGGPTA